MLASKQKEPTGDTSALERQIDEQVYSLYDLTLKEIELGEESFKGRKDNYEREHPYDIV